MNIYQHLSQMGKAPEDYFGKNVITIFKSESGNYGMGLFGKLMVVESDSDNDYKPLYRSSLECEFLDLEPEHLLSLFAVIHRKAKERGKQIKGKEA